MQTKEEFKADQAKTGGDDQAKKTNSKVVKKNIEFNGRVLEVHSGDSLTIQSIKKGGSSARFNFTNVRAPQIARSNMKPYAFEAKEFLRKHVIGKEVKVKMEYEKTIQVTRTEWDNDLDDYKDIQENKQLIFAQIWHEEKNVAQLMLEHGFANLQRPYSDEEKSFMYDELKESEDIAISKKIGLHSNQTYTQHKYNDISNSKNIKVNQWNLEHLKQGGKMHGIVELILSGGKFKVRVQDQSLYIMLMVAGVKCLPNDENMPGYDTWSNNALKFAKENLQQRDVTVTVKSMDRKGIFHGTLTVKKQDFGEMLLQEGLAVVYGDKNPQYDLIEEQARNNKVGLWKANLRLDAVMGGNKQKNIKYVNKTLRASVSEVVDLDEFYLQEPVNQVMNEIEKTMGDFDPEKYLTLAGNIKKGTPCVALFNQDGNFYRATVVKQVQHKKDYYLVHFSDYGNYDDVHFNDIRKMPDKLSKIPPQAMKCNLAFLQGPTKKSSYYQETIERFMDLVWEKKVTVKIVYTEADINFVMINTPDQPSVEKSVNAQLLRKGLAKLDTGVALSEDVQCLQEIQQSAQDKRSGAWMDEEDD